MKLPPAIDAAMWELAESDDQSALDAFASRYPEHKAELTQRIRMVRGLRGFKPSKTVKDKFVPAGDPLPMPTTNRWAVPLAATLLVGSLVFATVSATRWLDGQSHKDAVVRPTPPKSASPDKPVVLRGPGDNPAQRNDQPIDSHTDAPVKPDVPKTPWDNPVTLKSDRTNLEEALRAIAMQAGVSLEFAPNMPDIEIEADYRSQPAKLVMQDMGRNFGFSILVQTESTALVVPAIDPRAHPEPVVGNSAVARDVGSDSGQNP